MIFVYLMLLITVINVDLFVFRKLINEVTYSIKKTEARNFCIWKAKVSGKFTMAAYGNGSLIWHCCWMENELLNCPHVTHRRSKMWKTSEEIEDFILLDEK